MIDKGVYAIDYPQKKGLNLEKFVEGLYGRLDEISIFSEPQHYLLLGATTSVKVTNCPADSRLELEIRTALMYLGGILTDLFREYDAKYLSGINFKIDAKPLKKDSSSQE